MFTTPEHRKCEAVIHTESVLLSPPGAYELLGFLRLNFSLSNLFNYASDFNLFKENCSIVVRCYKVSNLQAGYHKMYSNVVSATSVLV